MDKPLLLKFANLVIRFQDGNFVRVTVDCLISKPCFKTLEFNPTVKV